MIRRAAVAVMILALGSTTLAGDKIELESGRELEGDIVREEKAWVGIDTGEGVVWVRRTEIKSIARDVPAPPEEEPPASDEPTPPVDADDVEAERRKPTEASQTPAAHSTGVATTTAADTERRSAEAERIQRALCSKDRDRRIAAADWIVETWPKWREAVKTTLQTAADEAPRMESVRLLDNEALADTAALIDLALDDKSAKVRAAALRVARHRKFTGVESRAVEMMRSDPTWVVRQEAIRTLEDVGGSMCLPHVMAAWSSETDKDKRRRYRRVMKALLGDDFGDDAVGWYRAADELFMGDREIRKGKKKTEDDRTR